MGAGHKEEGGGSKGEEGEVQSGPFPLFQGLLPQVQKSKKYR